MLGTLKGSWQGCRGGSLSTRSAQHCSKRTRKHSTAVPALISTRPPVPYRDLQDQQARLWCAVHRLGTLLRYGTALKVLGPITCASSLGEKRSSLRTLAWSEAVPCRPPPPAWARRKYDGCMGCIGRGGFTVAVVGTDEMKIRGLKSTGHGSVDTSFDGYSTVRRKESGGREEGTQIKWLSSKRVLILAVWWVGNPHPPDVLSGSRWFLCVPRSQTCQSSNRSNAACKLAPISTGRLWFGGRARCPCPLSPPASLPVRLRSLNRPRFTPLANRNTENRPRSGASCFAPGLPPAPVWRLCLSILRQPGRQGAP